ncbi:ABC transporter substrate-binding protein [Streptomyces sp. NBC_00696]|uniref:ABC transporter substrate-binding protein n=1 Tax=Streptomyces sp. NBC_00696 TaxID=2903672 RepID=UPI002E338DD9|nr:ABC transporter substrate-binding protein [Streptomyces sp. NBC_00696]
MTGRRRNRSTFLPTLTRPVRATALSAAALGACASLLAGCGVIPGVTGGSGGDSITVMTWAPWDTSATNKPGMPAMATAYAKWINKHGGINGRKLKVLTCNDHNTNVSAAKCAREAVAKNVVAVVGSYSEFSDSFFAPLEGAGIPYIGGYGVTTEEFTRALSYPVNGGQPALLAGLGKELGPACGPVTLVRPDSIAGDDLPPLLNAGLAAGGHAAATDQLAADDATEYSSQSTRALESATSSSGKEGCVVPSLGDRTDTFMDSFRRDRQDYPAVHAATVLGSVDQTEINSTGGQSGPYEGSYITGWYPVASDARWDPMKKAVNEVAFGDNRIDPADAGVQTTWIAYTAFKAVVNSLGSGDITSDTVRRALDDGVKVNTGDLTPTLQWSSRDDNLASVGLSRLVNASVTLQVVRKGVLVSAKKGFFDMTSTLESADLD